MGSQEIIWGDALIEMPMLAAASFDSCVTDPPYELGFMGRGWDKSGVSFRPETWRAVFELLKPGAHLLAFGGSRTSHRIACAIEDAGFEIRDTIMWLYGSGFPKSLDVSKAIDKQGGESIAWFGPWLRSERERRGIKQKDLAAHFPSKSGGVTGCVANWELGLNLPTPEQFNILCDALDLSFKRIEEVEREVIGYNDRPKGWFTGKDGHDITAPATETARQWEGWGTALKPAHEPIIVARKPLAEPNVAANVLEHGTGAINVDACRIEAADSQLVEKYASVRNAPPRDNNVYGADSRPRSEGNLEPHVLGRWPANVVLGCACEVEHEEGCAVRMLDEQSGDVKGAVSNGKRQGTGFHGNFGGQAQTPGFNDAGGASRFYYCAKATRDERAGGDHPTVKPVSLMRWLVRLVTPPGGRVLDPFAGTFKTGEACVIEGFDFAGIEQDAKHCETGRARMLRAQGKPAELPKVERRQIPTPLFEQQA
jgi:DNA modification methylase